MYVWYADLLNCEQKFISYYEVKIRGHSGQPTTSAFQFLLMQYKPISTFIPSKN